MKGQQVSGQEARKQGEEWAQIAGSKIDSTVNSFLLYSLSSLTKTLFQVNDVRKTVHDADSTITKKVAEVESKFDKFKADSASQLEKTKKETEKEFNQSIDNFDKTVERKTVEAKSGISSWFGFGK